MTLCSCLSIMVAQLFPFTTAMDRFLDPVPLSLATIDNSFSAILNDCTVSICRLCGVPSMCPMCSTTQGCFWATRTRQK